MSSKDIFLYIIFSIVIAIAYYGFGIVVRPLILPPTLAAPIWPAAGIAVGVIILWGYRYVPAILIGEILINLDFYQFDEFSDQPTLILTYGAMLLATTVRSVVGAYLVNRHLGQSNNYLTLASVIKLLIYAGLIPTFISSFISTVALYNNDMLEMKSWLISYLTWWFGDSVGVFIMLPLMFLVFKTPKNVWRPRLYKTAIPVAITFLLLLIVAQNLKHIEQVRIIEKLDYTIDSLTGDVVKIFNENNPIQDFITESQVTKHMNKIFSESTMDIVLSHNLQNIHYFIYSIKDGSENKIFDSSNTSNKLVNWNTERSFVFSNHEWKISAYATPEYYSDNASWLMWWLLSIGFLFIAILGAGLLIITGSNIIIKDIVVKRIKEIKTLNKILNDSKNRYKQLIEIQPVIFWKYIRGHEELDFLSNEAVKLLGYPKKDLINLKFMWDKLLHPQDFQKILTKYQKKIKTKDQFTLKYRVIANSGEIIWFKDFITTSKVNGNIEVIGLKVNITADQEKEQKIKQLAYFDTLTKLPNKVRFMLHLKKAIKRAQKNKTYGAVLYLDLDRFKVLNDSMGHYFGDKLLIQISERLNKLLKFTDVSSRFGGDEFVILIRNQYETVQAIEEEIKRVAKSVQSVISKPFKIDGHNFYTSFSSGISIFPHNSDNADEIIQQADIAMYSSKSQAKNTISFFENAMQKEANKRLNIEKALKIALIRHQFEMYYQPIFDQDKRIIRLEALIRWHHPTEGLLFPNSFINIAEETGFIIELSEWIVDNVFEQMEIWKKTNNEILPVAINISLFQFINNKLINNLKKFSEKYNINNNSVTLELTETIGIEDFNGVLLKLNKLKKLGFNIAIDDFGTGYSSLNYLTQMPIDILKLDKSFVKKIGTELNSDALIETIILMAKQLNMDVIVEGVETEEQFSFLKNLGCTKFQGYLVSKAVPIGELKLFS